MNLPHETNELIAQHRAKHEIQFLEMALNTLQTYTYSLASTLKVSHREKWSGSEILEETEAIMLAAKQDIEEHLKTLNSELDSE